MTTRARVLITGANGFIGGSLARAFATNGWEVIGTARGPRDDDAGITWRRYDLTGPGVPHELLAGVDVLVHAAYAKGGRHAGAWAMNVAGSERLFEAARAAGAFPIFLSSLAAIEGTRSEYGRSKIAIERLTGPDGAVVRPGLVIGAGGLFASLRQQVQRAGFIPLVDGGRQPLQTISIEELVAAIVAIARQRLPGTFTLAEAPPASYRAFFEYLASRSGTRAHFVPLPGWLVEAVAAIGARVVPGFPIDRDNVRGLRAMRPWEPTFDRRILDRPIGSYQASIERALVTGSRSAEGVAHRPRG